MKTAAVAALVSSTQAGVCPTFAMNIYTDSGCNTLDATATMLANYLAFNAPSFN